MMMTSGYMRDGAQDTYLLLALFFCFDPPCLNFLYMFYVATIPFPVLSSFFFRPSPSLLS